jgi:putative heme transporter
VSDSGEGGRRAEGGAGTPEASASQPAGESTSQASPPQPTGAPDASVSQQVTVPRTLAVATAWSWRLLVIGAAVIVVAYAAATLRLVVLPVFLALFFTALLRPVAERLRARGAPPFIAALVSVLLMLTIVAGVLAWIVPQFIAEFQDLADDFVGGVESAGDWLVEGPAGVEREELEGWVDNVVEEVRASTDEIVSGLVAGAAFAIELLAGLGIALVLTFFFLKDGDKIWDWIVGVFARTHHADVREMGSRSWATLAGYLRGMTIVALADSIFIGIALVILDVPGALALAVLIFFGAYIPIAGAVVTGALAVLVALIAVGLVTALLVLAAVIIVQQAESNLLHPYVVGRAVRVHPVAILLGVTAGAVLGGVIGAFVAVPIVAVAARIGGYIREQSDRTGEPTPAAESS